MQLEVGAEIPPVVVKMVAERKTKVKAAAQGGLAYHMCYMFEWEASMQLLHPVAVDVVVPPKGTKRESSTEDSYSHQMGARHY